MSNVCCYCKATFADPDDLRPYGPDGATTCHPCGTKPENAATTNRQLEKLYTPVREESFRTGKPIVFSNGGVPRVVDDIPADAVAVIVPLTRTP
jgi:hypothetical protein